MGDGNGGLYAGIQHLYEIWGNIEINKIIGENRMSNRIATKKTVYGSLGAILILIMGQVIAQLVGSVLVMLHIPEVICNIFAGILYVVCTYFLLKLFANKFLKMTMDELGIPKFGIKWKWLIIAILLPTIVTMIYLLLPGNMLYNENVPVAATVCTGIFFFGIGGGFVEEMVFRGLILNLFEKRWNKLAAIIIPSIVFAMMHIIGMEFSIVSIILVLIAGTMVGIMFSLIEQENHSVWNSGIVHALWNMVMAGNILYISSTSVEYSIFNYVLKSNSVFITGGEFGVESSLIAVAAYGIVILLGVHGIYKNLSQKSIK